MDIVNIIILIALAILLGFILVKLLKTVKNIVINIVLGFFVMIISGFIHLTPAALAWHWLTIIFCAFGGIFGAILMIVLYHLGIVSL